MHLYPTAAMEVKGQLLQGLQGASQALRDVSHS